VLDLPRESHQFPFPLDDGDYAEGQPNPAVDHGRVFYTIDQGVLELGARRVLSCCAFPGCAA